ncbi:MAG: DUF3313 domain-containing protein [Acetobacteraceae bacterium]|nr:DUF3313 domain-containing protein [Acetobacteraceae bacterium]
MTTRYRRLIRCAKPVPLALAASLVTAVTVAGCQQSGQFLQKESGGLFTPGQIIGGGTKQMSDVQVAPGFLPNASLLQPGGSGQMDLVYLASGANPSRYNTVMLDPIVILASPGSPLGDVAPDQRRALANTFYSDLYTALSQHCRMGSVTSPGTLRARFALVDAKGTNAVEDTVATYAPYVGVAYGVTSTLFNKGVGYFAGTATVEGYVTDASTGTLLWQGVDRRGGTTAAVENTLDTWLDVHHAFTAWSNQIASKLQQLGVCRS